MNVELIEERPSHMMLKPKGKANKDMICNVPIVVVKNLIASSFEVNVFKFENMAVLQLHMPFLGIDNHSRQIYFPRSEAIDPLLWDGEDPFEFLKDLILERELLEHLALKTC